jgi:hypothetical protein
MYKNEIEESLLQQVTSSSLTTSQRNHITAIQRIHELETEQQKLYDRILFLEKFTHHNTLTTNYLLYDPNNHQTTTISTAGGTDQSNTVTSRDNGNDSNTITSTIDNANVCHDLLTSSDATKVSESDHKTSLSVISDRPPLPNPDTIAISQSHQIVSPSLHIIRKDDYDHLQQQYEDQKNFTQQLQLELKQYHAQYQYDLLQHQQNEMKLQALNHELSGETNQLRMKMNLLEHKYHVMKAEKKVVVKELRALRDLGLYEGPLSS